MKILLSQYLDGISGSEIYLLKLAPKLAELGVQVQFALITSDPAREGVQTFIHTMQASGVPVTVFRMKKMPAPAQLKPLGRFLRKERFDLVHTHLLITDWVFFLLRKLLGVPFVQVSTKHGYQETYKAGHGLDVPYRRFDFYRIVCSVVERSIRRSFAVSQGLKSMYEGLRIARKGRMDVILHGLDYPETAANPALRLAPFQMIIVGRLVLFKGHIHALRAIRTLKEQYRQQNFKLVIVGNGPLEQELKQQCAALQIEDVVAFVGFQSNALEWMASSDVVLVPSIQEAFGLVNLEAMAVRKPVVGFDVSPMNEIIQDGKTGILCEAFSADAFAAGIARFLQHPELMEEYGNNGYRRQKEQFNLTRMATETIAFYKRALG